MAEKKLEGPSTCLTFLDFELDSKALEMHLLWDKLLDQHTLLAWSGRHSCCKKALEHLVGKQSPASRITQPGKTILSLAICIVLVTI